MEAVDAGFGRLIATAIALAAAALLLFGAAEVRGADCTLPGPEDATMSPSVTITGELATEQEGGYVYLPFDVPAGTSAVRIRYCHDQPEIAVPIPAPNAPKHVLDLGVYDARPGAGAIWGENEFRGWGGSSVRDVTVAPNGVSPDSVYEAGPDDHVTGYTTRAYVPGAIPSGAWAVELGVAAVASQQEGDADGKVAFEVRVETSADGVWSDEPYQPTPYDPTPSDPDSGWYAGDFHVHGEHEPGNATMRETFDYAFAPYGGEGAGLDFVTLVDHNNVNAYDEIGRYQPDYPGKLIIRSTEVTTYRGHVNSHAAGNFVDYRTGPLYEAELAGAGAMRTLGSLDQTSRAAAREVGARRDPRRRRLHPGQPPDDLPLHGAHLRRLLPRLLVGVLGRGDELLARRRDRGRDRAGGTANRSQPRTEPVHAARNPILGGRDRRRRPQRQPDRGGRLERLPPGDQALRDRPDRQPHRRPDRDGDHRRPRR